jgi:hypothetical protein
MDNQTSKSYLVKWLMCGIFAYFGINLITGFVEDIFRLIFIFLAPTIPVFVSTIIFFGVAKLIILILAFSYLIKQPFLPPKELVNKYLLIGLIVYGLLFFLNYGLRFLNTAIMAQRMDAAFWGQLNIYEQYISLGLAVLNTMTLIGFGIIALVADKNEQVHQESRIK